jgi:hypothetical protein
VLAANCATRGIIGALTARSARGAARLDKMLISGRDANALFAARRVTKGTPGMAVIAQAVVQSATTGLGIARNVTPVARRVSAHMCGDP